MALLQGNEHIWHLTREIFSIKGTGKENTNFEVELDRNSRQFIDGCKRVKIRRLKYVPRIFVQESMGILQEGALRGKTVVQTLKL